MIRSQISCFWSIKTGLKGLFFLSHASTFQLLDTPWSQVSSLPPPRFLPSIFIAHRVQQSHCSSILHQVLLLTHALALSASQFVHKKKKSRRILYEYALGGARTHETDLYLRGPVVQKPFRQKMVYLYTFIVARVHGRGAVRFV